MYSGIFVSTMGWIHQVLFQVWVTVGIMGLGVQLIQTLALNAVIFGIITVVITRE